MKRHRRGWYLIPNPIHHILRQFINAVVKVVGQFVLPVSRLEALNVPVYGLEPYGGACLITQPLLYRPVIFAPVHRVPPPDRTAPAKHVLETDSKTPIAFAHPSTADEDLILNVEFRGMTRGTTWMPSFESAFFRLQENHFSVPCNAPN